MAALAWISVGRGAHGLNPTLSVYPFSAQNPDGFAANSRHCERRYARIWACAHDREECDQVTRIPRRAFVRYATSAGFLAASTICQSPASSLDPQRDIRTAQPPPPALLLPVELMRVTVVKLNKILQQSNRWEEALSTLESPPLSETDFRTILDRYSDSNWGVHILGDLYRNEGLESIKAIKEIIAFSLEQQRQGIDISQQDVDDVLEAGRALATSLDRFVSLAPQADLRLVQKVVAEGLP